MKTVEKLSIPGDQETLQPYIDWIYTGKIPDITDYWGSMSIDQFIGGYLEVWALAEFMEDVDLKHAVVADIIARGSDSESTGFGLDTVDTAFSEHKFPEMREFIVEGFLININEGLVHSDALDWYKDFTKALGRAALRAVGKEKPTHEALLEKYTNGKYKIVTKDDDED
jgi:hypothetical protein